MNTYDLGTRIRVTGYDGIKNLMIDWLGALVLGRIGMPQVDEQANMLLEFLKATPDHICECRCANECTCEISEIKSSVTCVEHAIRSFASRLATMESAIAATPPRPMRQAAQPDRRRARAGYVQDALVDLYAGNPGRAFSLDEIVTLLEPTCPNVRDLRRSVVQVLCRDTRFERAGKRGNYRWRDDAPVE